MKILLTVITLLVLATGTAIACQPYVDVTPTTEPTIAPSVEPTVEVTVEPTIEPTVQPTATPSAETSGDGLGDGKSDGLSSCPSCTAAPVIPSGPPATGRG